MESYIDDSRIHTGHRSRMRSKLFAHGQRIFDTYELLEMLLYQVIPYRDTNPIAKRLLHTFDDLDGVLSATAEELAACDGIGAYASEFISEVGRLSHIIGAELLSEDAPELSGYDDIGRYITDYFKDSSDKRVIALYFDSGMHLKCLKKLYDLEYESGGVKPKAFIDGAIECSASVVITAHNHPYGPFYPTQGDRATNEAVTSALTRSGIVHAEHYIVCGDQYAGMGMLENFSAKFSQMPALSRFYESRDGKRMKLASGDSTAPDLQADCGYNRLDFDYFKRLIAYCSEQKAQTWADMLIKRYKTIENVISASARELAQLTDERCASYLKLLAYITSRRSTDRFMPGAVYSKAAIADYLKALYLGESVEKIYLIAFDQRGRFLGCELIGEGTVGASEVMPRKAVDTALILKASSVSVAHNHPLGTTRPSNDDIAVTKLFEGLFADCDIRFCDHYIVAGQLCDIIKI